MYNNSRIKGDLLSGGWPAVEQSLAETKKTIRKKSGRQALNKLGGYLGRQPEHLEYAQRLVERRSIGSGQAEGACKPMICRRLKQTRVNRMVNLYGLIYSDHWGSYWKKTRRHNPLLHPRAFTDRPLASTVLA